MTVERITIHVYVDTAVTDADDAIKSTVDICNSLARKPGYDVGIVNRQGTWIQNFDAAELTGDDLFPTVTNPVEQKES